MSAVSIQRPHVHKGTLGLALLSVCFAFFASPASAVDRTLTSYGALCNGSADDTPELREAFSDAGSALDEPDLPILGRLSHRR